MVKCPICSAEKEDTTELCRDHQRASRNIKNRFEEWKTAMDTDWEDYLKQISENANTGAWAREVAVYLLKTTKPR